MVQILVVLLFIGLAISIYPAIVQLITCVHYHKAKLMTKRDVLILVIEAFFETAIYTTLLLFVIFLLLKKFGSALFG